jgi:hypothetical protein
MAETCSKTNARKPSLKLIPKGMKYVLEFNKLENSGVKNRRARNVSNN